jgi:hypothetical protein
MKNDVKLIEKQKSHAFGKDIYLLGRLYNERIWLEAASWDCNWYWGFGYIESYTNDRSPANSRDINSHTHYDSTCFVKDDKGNFIHLLCEVPGLTECTLTEKEQWQLSDLMKSFYTLEETSALFHTGNSHYTTVPELDLKNPELENHINKELLPKVFKQVYKLLSPNED